MLHKFLVFYKQNKILLFVIIGITALILAVIHIANNNAREQRIREESIIAKNKNSDTSGKGNIIGDTAFSSDVSQVEGNQVSKTDINNSNQYIGEFMNKCFQNKVEEAYNMISEECKKAMFSNIEVFEKIYLSNILNIQDPSYDISNWVNNIYIVKIYTDPLASGKYDGKPLTDYITLIEENSEYKLNINSYITQEKINSHKKIYNDKIEFNVIKKDSYMNFEEYEIEVINNSGEDIVLDSKSNTGSMYIEDTDKVKYNSYSQELSEADLIIYKNNARKVKIKYYSKYNSNKDITKLVFTNVILRYEVDETIVSEEQFAPVEINV